MRVSELGLFLLLLLEVGCKPNDVVFDLAVPAGTAWVDVYSHDRVTGADRLTSGRPTGGRIWLSLVVRDRDELEHSLAARTAEVGGETLAFLEVCTQGPMRVALPLGPALDADHDGFRHRTRAGCGTELLDCDDTDATIFPRAFADPSRCGIDSDCDLRVELCPDLDRDGTRACSRDVVTACDCDDTRADVDPGAFEICGDGVDQNCDGSDIPCDDDGDGFDTTLDCDDAAAAIHPGALERCDGRDEDCDGRIDETAPCRTTDRDLDGELECVAGDTVPCDPNDCDPGVASTALDRCGDGVDADGDGTDPACDPDDRDGDGFYAITAGGSDCDDGDPFTYPLAPDFCQDGIAQNCRNDRSCALDEDGDGWIEPPLCEGDPENAPGNVELCDGRDDDCDGSVDEVLAMPSAVLPHGARGCTADPRELDFTRDFSNCGACGRSCEGVGDACQDGTCRCGRGFGCIGSDRCCAGRCTPASCAP